MLSYADARFTVPARSPTGMLSRTVCPKAGMSPAFSVCWVLPAQASSALSVPAVPAGISSTPAAVLSDPVPGKVRPAPESAASGVGASKTKVLHLSPPTGMSVNDFLADLMTKHTIVSFREMLPSMNDIFVETVTRKEAQL